MGQDLELKVGYLLEEARGRLVGGMRFFPCTRAQRRVHGGVVATPTRPLPPEATAPLPECALLSRLMTF